MLWKRTGISGTLHLLPIVFGLAACDAVVETIESQAALSDGADGAGSFSIEVVAGDGQTGVVGEALRDPIELKVVDGRGRPRRGVTVRLDTREGSGTFEPASGRTNSEGRVRATWRVGSRAGEKLAAAYVVGSRGERGDSATLRATALPGPARRLEVVAGGDQTGRAGAPLPEPVVVAVADRFGNAVPGARVRWSVLEGGGRFDRDAGASDVEGRAAATWTLGPKAGPQVAAARVEGADPVTFTARAAGGAAGGVAIVPSEVYLEALHDTIRLSAMVTDADGTELAGVSISWQSLEPAIASVQSSGLVEALANGVARIVASASDRSDTARVTVQQKGDRIIVSPGSARLNAIGDTLRATARVVDANGNEVGGAAVGWSSSNPSIAQVDQMGRIVSKGVGVALVTVTALCCDVETLEVEVRQVVAVLEVTPSSLSVPVGGTGQFAAVAADSNGVAIDNVGLTWRSSDPGVASVVDGVVQAHKEGTAIITATAGDKSDSATVTVGPGGGSGSAPVASVTISPSSLSLVVQESRQLNVTLKDASGNVLTGRTVTWKSSAAGVATVSAVGLVMALAPGTATITAESEGKSGTATVTVTTPPPPGQFAPPDILSHNFEDGRLSPFTTGGGSSTGSANVFVANDPTGLFGGKVVHMHYAGCADVNRAIAAYDQPVPMGATRYVRGHLVIPRPQASMADAMRKLYYVQRVPNDGSFIVLKTDGGHLKLEWATRPWIVSGPAIAFDRKYSIEMGFRVNSAPGAKDGWIRVWLDGQLVIDVQNTDIVTSNPSSLLKTFLIGQQSQGPNMECHDEWRYWDNVAISTKRIGP